MTDHAQNADCVVVELTTEEGDTSPYCEAHHRLAVLCEDRSPDDDSLLIDGTDHV